jgi:hypothetical protein
MIIKLADAVHRDINTTMKKGTKKGFELRQASSEGQSNTDPVTKESQYATKAANKAETKKMKSEKVKLDILAFLGGQLQTLDRRDIPKNEVAEACGYSAPGSHGFFYPLKELVAEGKIMRSSTKGCICLTDDGIISIPLHAVAPPRMDNAGRQAQLLKSLMKCKQGVPDKMSVVFNIFIDGRPHGLDELTQETGYKNMSSQGLGYPISFMINTMKILKKVKADTWQFTDKCFPEGRP